jgi:hypothetical protein
LKKSLLNSKTRTRKTKTKVKLKYNLKNHKRNKLLRKRETLRLNRNLRNLLLRPQHLLRSTMNVKTSSGSQLGKSSLSKGRRLLTEESLTKKAALLTCRWPPLYSIRWTKLKKMIARVTRPVNLPSKNFLC